MLVTSESNLLATVAITFALIAHPKMYLLVHQLFKKVGAPIVNQFGVATTTGLLIHALVAAFLTVTIVHYI